MSYKKHDKQKSLWRYGQQSTLTVGLTVVLFLIGTGPSRETVKRVGARPFIQGILLWAVIAVLSLMAIRPGWISL